MLPLPDVLLGATLIGATLHGEGEPMGASRRAGAAGQRARSTWSPTGDVTVTRGGPVT